jgi:hypothetical protein
LWLDANQVAGNEVPNHALRQRAPILRGEFAWRNWASRTPIGPNFKELRPLPPLIVAALVFLFANGVAALYIAP